MRAAASRVTGREDLARADGDGHERPGSSAPLRWPRAGLSGAAGQVRARVGDAARSVIRLAARRAARWLRGTMRPPARLARSVFLATTGKDRGLAFWWLAAAAAVALITGVLVAALVSPAAGIAAALAVGIWMLIRRRRPAQSRKTAQAHLAS